MNILMIGGTQFLGRHLVETALQAGHTLTLFNRGKTNPGLFAGVETIAGDRDSDLGKLAGRRWDVVIDTCGYIPRHVRTAAEALAERVEQYIFISTISVYSDTTLHDMDESGPLATLVDESVEEITGETYGGLKVLCERAAEGVMPGRVLHVRSGLIVGPHDPTDRFTYWPVRIAEGGEVLAAGNPDAPVQFIDARDQAAWILHMATARKSGIYNLTGPAERLTMRALLDACRETAASDATFTWADDEFLLEHEVAPYTDLPLWLPESYGGLQTIRVTRALADGLTCRPLAQTIRDTLDWNATRPPATPEKPRRGITRAREAELLAAWKAKGT